MIIKFNKIKFKNILSYGNKESEVVFDKGLNLISAQNGCGKSSIIDALNFCLFGKPYRDIKLENLINKNNGKGLLVEVEFSRGKDNYVVKRGLKPNVFELSKNGSSLESLSSKKLNQEELNKILGIDEKLFKNIVALGVNNNKPFLQMSLGEKRALIESIFNINVLSDMSKEVKKRNSLNTTDQKVKLSELSGYKNSKKEMVNYIEFLQSQRDSFVANKAREIELKEKEILDIEKIIATSSSNIEKGNKNILHIGENLKPHNHNELTEINSQISVLNYSKAEAEKKLSRISSEAFCPVCNSPLDGEHAKKHKKDLSDEIKNTEKKLVELTKKRDEITKQKNVFEHDSSLIEQIKEKVRGQESIIKSNTLLLESKKNDLKAIQSKENDVSDTQIDKLNEKLAILEDSITNTNSQINELSSKISMDTELLKILSDEGLRYFFLQKIIPQFNFYINEYLTKFEMDLYIEFDNMLEVSITQGKFNLSYQQFSAGEKTRIDMAILLSFYKLSKNMSNWSSSILFIDEILDSGVDTSGTQSFLKALSNIVKKEDKKLGIYLISHKLNGVEMKWDNILEVNKKGFFSSIVKK